MQTVKLLSLAATIVICQMALGWHGVASATEVYSGGETQAAGTQLRWSLESGTKLRFASTSASPLVECSGSEIQENISAAGGSGLPVTTKVESTSFSSCTFSTTTTVLGSTSFVSTGGTGATVDAAAETAVTFNTVLFGSCTYKVTAGTSVGIITTSVPATRHFNAVGTKTSGGAACPETVKIAAAYVATKPSHSGPPRFEVS